MKSKKDLLGVLTTKIKKLAKAIISHNALLGGWGDFKKGGCRGMISKYPYSLMSFIPFFKKLKNN